MQESVDTNNAVLRMSAITEASPFLHLFYIMPDGTSYADNDMVFNVSEREYFLQAKGGVRSIQMLQHAYGDGSARFVLAVPVIKDVNVIAVIAGSYNEELLRKLLISRIYGGSAYSTVYNSNGDYVIGTDNVNYLLTESNVYDSLGKVSLDGKYTIEDIKKSIQKGEMGSFLYTVNASKRCVVYVPLDIVSANGYRWVMFNVVPYSVIENEAALFTRNSTFTFAAVLILIIILFTVFIRRERTNIKKLREDAEQLRIREEQFRIAASHGGRAVARYDIKTKTYYNDSDLLFLQGFGSIIHNVPESIINKNMVAPASVDDFLGFYADMNSGLSECNVDALLRTPDDTFSWFHLEAGISFNAEGTPVQAIIIFYDISEQREKEAIYRKWQQSLKDTPAEEYTLFRANLTKDSSLDAVEGSLLQIDFSDEATSFNKRTDEYAEQYVYSDDVEEYVKLLNSENLLANYYRGNRTSSMDYREKTPEGGLRWIRVSVEMVQYPNSEDIEVYLMYSDIDEEKKAQEITKKRAESDPLTGALN